MRKYTHSRKEWEEQVVASGGRIFTATGTPEFNREKELLAGDFRVVNNPKKGAGLKKIRDKFAREMRKDGWLVWVEPKSTFFTNEGVGEGYSFSATRLK